MESRTHNSHVHHNRYLKCHFLNVSVTAGCFKKASESGPPCLDLFYLFRFTSAPPKKKNQTNEISGHRTFIFCDIYQWGTTGSQLISTSTQWAIVACKRQMLDSEWYIWWPANLYWTRNGLMGGESRQVHTSDRQTQPRGDKQSLTPGSRRPVGRHWCACSGIEGKCQAKHTSMEARRHCQGVLMQPAWCFSNEDMLYTAEKTRGTQTRGGEAQTITQRISPTEGIKQKREAEPNGEDDSRQKGVADSLLRP